MTNFNKSSMTENRKKSVCKSKRQWDYPHPLMAELATFCKNKSLKISRNCHMHWFSELKTTFFAFAIRFYITVGFLAHIHRFLLILAELATFCKNKWLKISRKRHMHWVSELKTTFFEFAARCYITVGFLAHIQRFLVILARLATFCKNKSLKISQKWHLHGFSGLKTIFLNSPSDFT